jgi:hypothetical protein
MTQPKRKGFPPTPIEKRFWPKVRKTETCWLWTGTKNERGYGFTTYTDGRNAKAHRVAWELTNGPIPEGLWVLHRCDVPSCVRPDHLFLGDAKENTRDMHAKGRARNGNERKTHCPAGHEYTKENTVISDRKRSCRACKSHRQKLTGAAYSRQYRARRRVGVETSTGGD